MIISLTGEHSPMNKVFKFTLFFYLLINIFNISISSEKFFNKALELYENISNLDPTNLYALEGKARSLSRIGKLEEAEDIFL